APDRAARSRPSPRRGPPLRRTGRPRRGPRRGARGPARGRPRGGPGPVRGHAARDGAHGRRPRRGPHPLPAYAATRGSAPRTEAPEVLREAVHEAARARAGFMLGEMARMDGDHAGARTHYQLVMRIEDQLMGRMRSDPTAARWYARARGRIAELDAGAGAFAAA